jgi:hypothetical protein
MVKSPPSILFPTISHQFIHDSSIYIYIFIFIYICIIIYICPQQVDQNCVKKNPEECMGTLQNHEVAGNPGALTRHR